MEDDLGVSLVERRKGGIRLTPAGEETVRRAKSLLRDAQDLRDAVRMPQSALLGRLRLGVLPSVGAYFLPVATRVLHEKYPKLRLYVQEGHTEALESGLLNGDFDCILSTLSDHDELVSEPLFQESLWTCSAPEDSINNDDGPISPDQLRGKTLICLDERFELAELSALETERGEERVTGCVALG